MGGICSNVLLRRFSEKVIQQENGKPFEYESSPEIGPPKRGPQGIRALLHIWPMEVGEDKEDTRLKSGMLLGDTPPVASLCLVYSAGLNNVHGGIVAP